MSFFDTSQEIIAYAYKEGPKWWTIEIPELSRKTQDGERIIAVGGSPRKSAVKKAACELASVWLNVVPEDVNVKVEFVSSSRMD